MKKVLLVIAHEDFEDAELMAMRETLISCGHRCVIASTNLSFATGMRGTKVKPDVDLDEAAINVNSYSAVVFLSGKGVSRYVNNPICHAIVKAACKEGKIVGAICKAPMILAKAGVLDGVEVTVYTKPMNRQMADEIRMCGARYIDRDVVVDKNIVTACGPNACNKFAEKIAELIGSKS